MSADSATLALVHSGRQAGRTGDAPPADQFAETLPQTDKTITKSCKTVHPDRAISRKTLGFPRIQPSGKLFAEELSIRVLRADLIQNGPKLIKIDHHERTISSAQWHFRRNTPEKFFAAKLTRRHVERSPHPERSRTKPNTAERPNASRSALSGSCAFGDPIFFLCRTRSENRPIYSELSSCGVTMILQCSSGSPSVSNAPSTPSRPTRPVTIGPG